MMLRRKGHISLMQLADAYAADGRIDVYVRNAATLLVVTPLQGTTRRPRPAG